MSRNRNIILGVTGSIAAHKAADLASWLTRQKCSVRVVMTADAQRFITPLPFKVLSRHPVVTGLYDEEEAGSRRTLKWRIPPAFCSLRRRRRMSSRNWRMVWRTTR